MIASTSHIIERVLIDIDVNSMEIANDIKENSDHWVRKVLIEALSAYFDKQYEKLGDNRIQLDALELEIDIDSLRDNPRVLADEFSRKIHRVLGPIIDNVIVQRSPVKGKLSKELEFGLGSNIERNDLPRIESESQRLLKSFLYFLDTGKLPWWLTSNSELTALLEEEKLSVMFSAHANELVDALKKRVDNQRFVQRLNDQFSDELKWNLLKVVVHELHGIHLTKGELPKQLFKELMKSSSNRTAVFSLLLSAVYLRKERNSNRFERELFNEIWRNPSLFFNNGSISAFEKFSFVTSISVLSNGVVNDHKSKEELLIHGAKLLVKELTSDQIEAISLSEDNPQPTSAVREVFYERLIELQNKRSSGRNHREEDNRRESQKMVENTVEDFNDELNDSKQANEKKSALEEAIDNLESTTEQNERLEDANESLEAPEMREGSSLENQHLPVTENSKVAVKDDLKKNHESDIMKSSTDPKDSNEEQQRLIENGQASNSEEALQQTTSSKKEKNHSLVDEKVMEESGISSRDKMFEKEVSQPESGIVDLVRKLSQERENSKSDKEVQIDEYSFLAENGGLVLLNPFIPTLFKNLEWIDDDNSIKDNVRAVIMLHFLATGNEGVFEHHLTFEKYLCNVNQDHVISREIRLTEREKEEALNVLIAACDHWKKLKNASVDLVRNEFLQRNCKVNITPNSERVKIERKVFDILLDSLPWSIGMIRFPWKKEIIFVEW